VAARSLGCRAAQGNPSGRSLDFIEDFIRDAVLPLREDARRMIRDAVGGTDDDLVIFCGSSATAAVSKLIGVLELRIPAGLDSDMSSPPVSRSPRGRWFSWARTSADLECQLVRFAGRRLRIGSFSAASNVTGILTDTVGFPVPAQISRRTADARRPGGTPGTGPQRGPDRARWRHGGTDYFISPATAGYIADAVGLVAAEGYRLLPDYSFDPRTGLRRHARQDRQTLLRLTELRYGAAGEMTYPRRRAQAGKDAFRSISARPVHCWRHVLLFLTTARPGSARASRRCLVPAPSRLPQVPAGQLGRTFGQWALRTMRSMRRLICPKRHSWSGIERRLRSVRGVGSGAAAMRSPEVFMGILSGRRGGSAVRLLVSPRLHSGRNAQPGRALAL